jgi:hypothetical protein
MSYLKHILIVLCTLLLAYATSQAWQIYTYQKQVDGLEQHYADINKIDYGLFNMQAWKEKAFHVFRGHIDHFKISKSAYVEAESELNDYLNGVYDKYIATGEVFNKIFDDAEKSGKVNKMILKLLRENVKTQIEALNIKGHIPSLAKQLAKELKNNEPRFNDIMQKELVKLMQYDEKYPYTDPRQALFISKNCDELKCYNIALNQEITAVNTKIKGAVFYFLLSILSMLSLIGIGYRRLGSKLYIAALSLVSLLLLALGISMPMIKLDARLNSFVFSLFEQDLGFEEQVIFYQSKSILDVTKNLLDSRGLDLKIVGIMILCFSVVFPLIKLILSGLYLFFEKVRNSKIAKGMIFYLGKWSMADVFVVALFMAYIGFYGLINAQLQSIEHNKGGFAVETVNYTRLSIGAFFFTAYCILSIILGLLVYKEDKRHER